MIRVCLAGITGWIGRPLAAAIAETEDVRLVAAVARRAAGSHEGGVVVSGTIAEAMATPFDVLVEYTGAGSVREHALAAIDAGRRVVIGSSGLTTAELAEIDKLARLRGVGVVAVGNFAISAALLQRFAVEAARHFASWEIVDSAGAGKVDAPSGMARELAWRLSEIHAPDPGVPIDGTLGDREARGASIDGSRVHSLRLPGHTIGLEIRFGKPDERLTIQYDGGPGAGPYIGGTILAIRKVFEVTGLVRGLDRLL
ncbi:MAG: 4-hydroxy-tetrahydrodipicolinate reductase [Acidobacteria bacterium]|nr:4-hydroxy-tetrahydrodipicolinate reductase [Acidobacteriota bacterium]